MKEFIPQRYWLPCAAGAFFMGCLGAAQGGLTIWIALPWLALALWSFFMQWKKRERGILPVLLILVLFGGLLYQLADGRQSTLLRFEGQTVFMEGVVAEATVKTDYGVKVILKQVYYMEGEKKHFCNEKLQLTLKEEEDILFGDRIKVLGMVERAAKLRNFGDFDFAQYYKSKNIYAKARALRVEKLASHQAGWVSGILYHSNQKIKSVIFSAMPQKEAAILYGILTGSKSDMDEETKETFALTGLAHILSVSGLHVGFLVLMLNFILQPAKVKKGYKDLAVFLVVFFYILVIGAPVPAVRSLLMLGVMQLGSLLGKSYDLNTSSSLAALVLLGVNPLLIHDPSYIISFACMFSIGFLQPSVNRRLYFLPAWLRSSLSLSIAVWLGITPVLIGYFNYVSFINILLNVLAVPISLVITLAGFGAVILSIVMPFLGAYVFASAYYFIRMLCYLSDKALLLPLSGMKVPALRWYIQWIYYGGVWMLVEDFWKHRSDRFKRNYRTLMAAALLVACILWLLPRPLELYFVDVGQGDCSILKTPEGKAVIIDGGGSPQWQKGSYDVGEKVTLPALLHLGIWQVDTMVVSHIDNDHLGGLLAVLEHYKVKRVLLPASDRYGEDGYDTLNYHKLLEICRQKNIPILYLEKNDRVSLGKQLSMKVLWPQKPYIINSASDVNNNAMVFMLSYKDFDALYTGDIQQEAEAKLGMQAIQCEVLKVAHHGSPYSSVAEFLAQARPSLSILSVGEDNRYGHPAPEVLKRLEAVGSKVLRTDTSGAVRLTTNGRKIRLTTVR
jgi:competence protein ComEC